MDNNTTPPLPPGFELVGNAPVVQQANQTAEQGMPPLPPGFELVREDGPGLEIDIVGGTPESKATPEQIAADRALDQKQNGETRKSLFRMDSDFRKHAGVGYGDMLWASARDMFGGREGAGEYLAEQAGGTLGRDKDGEPTVVLPDGTAYRLNDPGIDSTDVANVAGNVAAFFTPAGWAARVAEARGMGLAGRALLQGTTAGATDAALQTGFNSGQVNPLRVATAAAGGAGGEVVGSGLGQLARWWNPASIGARQSAAAITQEPSRINALAREFDSGADQNALLGQERYGLAYTLGQRMTDPKQQFAQLSREELLRQNPVAGNLFREQSARNAEALETTLGDMGTSMGGRAGATPAEMAQGASARLGQQADELGGRITEAYGDAAKGMRTAVSGDAVRELPGRLTRAVSDFSPNETLTPATAKTLQQVTNATQMFLGPNGERSNVSGITLKALEAQRRIINNNIGAAANPADRKAMVAIKREFDSWLDQSIDGALVSGDPAALEAIKKARGLRAEFGRRFEGDMDSDKFISGLLDGTKTPEELVNIALGASQVSKAGGARFIERLRTASNNDPGVVGNLRAAHFLRLTRGADGKPLSMGQIIRNVRSTEYNNASIVKALYSPTEWAEVKQLAGALEPLVAKGDFAKSSGSTERLARMLFQRVGNVPVIGWGTKFAGDTVAHFRADRALNAPLKLPVKVPQGYATAGAATSAQATR